MRKSAPKTTIAAPPGRPHWLASGKSSLIYLGWGHRNYLKQPLPLHSDLGTNYLVLLRGKFEVGTNSVTRTVRGPAVCIFDPDCEFRISQPGQDDVEILVWVWAGTAGHQELRPQWGEFVTLPLNPPSIQPIMDLHSRCRREVSIADSEVRSTFPALRELMEVEMKRGVASVPKAADARFDLALAWMRNNLRIHAPVPALCDYLGLSRRTLHRFFISTTGSSPGIFFRSLKADEAHRLVHEEGWQMKAVAFHLGYNHPNDLSRVLSKRKTISEKSIPQNRMFQHPIPTK